SAYEKGALARAVRKRSMALLLGRWRRNIGSRLGLARSSRQDLDLGARVLLYAGSASAVVLASRRGPETFVEAARIIEHALIDPQHALIDPRCRRRARPGSRRRRSVGEEGRDPPPPQRAAVRLRHARHG